MTSSERGATTLFRAVRGNPPSGDDFMSNEANKLPAPTGRDEARLWSGISTFDKFERARKKAIAYPWLGSFVAELVIPADPAVRIERTGNSRGHFTVWGEPSTLLGFIVGTKPVGE